MFVIVFSNVTDISFFFLLFFFFVCVLLLCCYLCLFVLLLLFVFVFSFFQNGISLESLFLLFSSSFFLFLSCLLLSLT